LNPRQRRGALLIAVAAIGAIAVFVMVANYVGDVRSQVGPMARAVQLTTDLDANQLVTEDMLGSVEVPERWLNSAAVNDVSQVVGLVTPVALSSGVVLQEGMLQLPPEIEAGQREISILVDAETGVAGRIGPGSVVDIVATFSGGEDVPNQAFVMIQNARILEVGIPTTEAGEDGEGAFQQSEVVPVTFALTDAESLRLAYVESFAQRVRLVLKSPTDDRILDDDERLYQPDLGALPEAETGLPAEPPPPPPEVPLPPPVPEDEPDDEPDDDEPADEPDDEPDEDDADEDDEDDADQDEDNG
jgi:Flp pilus assembly protein CpaB